MVLDILAREVYEYAVENSEALGIEGIISPDSIVNGEVDLGDLWRFRDSYFWRIVECVADRGNNSPQKKMAVALMNRDIPDCSHEYIANIPLLCQTEDDRARGLTSHKELVLDSKEKDEYTRNLDRAKEINNEHNRQFGEKALVTENFHVLTPKISIKEVDPLFQDLKVIKAQNEDRIDDIVHIASNDGIDWRLLHNGFVKVLVRNKRGYLWDEDKYDDSIPYDINGEEGKIINIHDHLGSKAPHLASCVTLIVRVYDFRCFL